MVDRIGEWFAFSRACYCRRLTIYEQLPWGAEDTPHSSFCPSSPPPAPAGPASTSDGLHGPRGFSLATADLVAVARFGGLVAVYGRVHSTAGLAGPSLVFSSDGTGASVQQFNLSAHSAAVAGSSPAACGDTDKALQVYTSGGELLAVAPLTPSILTGADAVAALGWTGEGELYVLLTPSLTVVFLDTRDIALDHLAAASSSGAEAIVSRRVSLRPEASAAAPPLHAPLAGLRATAEGILCVEDIDGRGRLRGLLHEEKFSSLVLASVPLPVNTTFMTSGTAAVPHRSRPAVLTSPAALDMVPPAWTDSGDLLVLWAQPAESRSGSSVLCAMVHPDDGGGGSDHAGGGSASPAVRRMACPGRVLELTVCVADPTQVAVFTSLGVLHVLRSNLSAALFGLDLGVCRVLRTAAAVMQVGDSSGATVSFASPAGASFGAGAAASTSFASGGGLDTAADGTAAAQRNGNATITAAAAERAVDCPAPHKVEWCGRHFVLVHFYEADLESGNVRATAGLSPAALAELRQERPMLSLLVCTQDGCSVRCERLDWGEDGSGHIATVAEFDGVRVMTDTTCYALQEVPGCLARLCRVQPSFSPAAQVVLAYEACTSGDRHGIAQVRAALAAVASPAAAGANSSPVPSALPEESPPTAVTEDDDENVGADGEETWATTPAEGLVCELLDAASHEFDVARQHLLIAAASFACETTHLRSGVPDVIVDVARRLRVLRAVRTEPRCHMPITMEQYQLLTGSQERPARRLTSTEGQVLVDRLAYLGHYQTALDLVRAMHMKFARVLARWAASFIRRHVGRMSDSTLHRELVQVLREFPDASYVEPATTAFALHRGELALRLLRDEPQHQRRRVLLCVELGELNMAGRAAAASGSAELIHLVVSALVAREAQSRRATSSPPRPRGAAESEDEQPPVTLAEVQHCLIASPELLCWLLVGASSLSAWQAVAQRVLFTAHWSLAALECHSMAVQGLRQSTTVHRSQLQRLVPDRTRAAEKPNTDGEAKEAAATHATEKKRKRHHRGRADDEVEHSTDSDDEDDPASPGAAARNAAAASLPLPPLAIPCATAAAASAAFTQWTRETTGLLHSAFQRAGEMRRDKAAAAAASAGETPFAALLSRAERLREAAHEAAQSGTPSPASEAADGSGGGGGAASTTSNTLAQEWCVRTVLAAPASRPSRDAAALAMQVKLDRARSDLAAKHNAPRLTRCVVSVVDLVHELCAIPDAAGDVSEVQRTFAMPAKMLFFAQLRGLCTAQRWDAVDSLVGPAPPLQKRSFFSGGDTGARTPCIGYLPVVQLLAQHGQHERAARYVAGACAEAVDRVSWYMSLGAPVMALEAAMAERDGGLVAQVMQRVPDSATVQSVGSAMLTELRQG